MCSGWSWVACRRPRDQHAALRRALVVVLRAPALCLVAGVRDASARAGQREQLRGELRPLERSAGEPRQSQHRRAVAPWQALDRPQAHRPAEAPADETRDRLGRGEPAGNDPRVRPKTAVDCVERHRVPLPDAIRVDAERRIRAAVRFDVRAPTRVQLLVAVRVARRGVQVRLAELVAELMIDRGQRGVVVGILPDDCGRGIPQPRPRARAYDELM